MLFILKGNLSMELGELQGNNDKLKGENYVN